MTETGTNNEVHVASSDRMMFGIVSAITVALLLWVGATLNSNQISVGKLQVEVAGLTAQFKRSDLDKREVLRRLSLLEQDVAALKMKGQ